MANDFLLPRLGEEGFGLDYDMGSYQSDLGYSGGDLGADTGGFGSNFFGKGKDLGFNMDTVGVLGGLAGMYMDWDKLQATKSSARDAHNAAAMQYNNYLQRSKDVSASMGLAAGGRQDIRKSTV